MYVHIYIYTYMYVDIILGFQLEDRITNKHTHIHT